METGKRLEITRNMGTHTTALGHLPTGPEETRERIEVMAVKEEKAILTPGPSVITTMAGRRGVTRQEECPASVVEAFTVAEAVSTVVAVVSTAAVHIVK
jgi:hypothetical protein